MQVVVLKSTANAMTPGTKNSSSPIVSVMVVLVVGAVYLASGLWELAK